MASIPNLRSCQADELRGLRAKRRVTLFELSKDLNLATCTLSQYLNARAPMPPGLAERLREAIERLSLSGVPR